MTAILSVNENNDIFLTAGGSIAISRDLQAVAQQSRTRHKSPAIRNDIRRRSEG